MVKKVECLIKQAKQDKKKISDLKLWLDKFKEYKILEKEILEIQNEENEIKKGLALKQIKISNLGIQLII
jgi:hypothetical protein